MQIMVFCGNKHNKSTFTNYSEQFATDGNVTLDILGQNNFKTPVMLGDDPEDFKEFINSYNP